MAQHVDCLYLASFWVNGGLPTHTFPVAVFRAGRRMCKDHVRHQAGQQRAACTHRFTAYFSPHPNQLSGLLGGADPLQCFSVLGCLSLSSCSTMGGWEDGSVGGCIVIFHARKHFVISAAVLIPLK
jgi:hypothetical protein